MRPIINEEPTITSENEEPTITSEVAPLLREKTYGYTIESEQKPFVDSAKKPDIMVRRMGYETIAIEAKPYYKNVQEGVDQIHEHFGRVLDDNWRGTSITLQTGMVIRYPEAASTKPQAELREFLEDSDEFEYCLITADGGGNFPKGGMVRGSLNDIATALSIGAVPAEKIKAASEKMDEGMRDAVNDIEQAIARRPALGVHLSNILGESVTTEACCKASLFIIDAFIFQDELAGKAEFADVKPLNAYTPPKRIYYNKVIDDWLRILKVNYVPIFKDAARIIDQLHDYDERVCRTVLRKLWSTANDIVKHHRHQIHELAGEVFQELVADRRYVKANYTLPESAALLSALVCDDIDPKNLPKVADYACGTGSLLNGVYKQVRRLYERKTGASSSDIHQEMLEENLAGSDIFPHATHLTFTVMASAHPEVALGATRVITAPYGKKGEGIYKTGSLELLDNQLLWGEFGDETVIIRGDEVETTVEMKHEFPDGEMDIVIINPPFTRDGADPGWEDSKNTFQSEHHSEDVKKLLQAELRKKPQLRVYDKDAGLASAFIDLADRKLKAGGKLGYIVPLTMLSGDGWMKVRQMLAEEYHDVIVITLAGSSGFDMAFSHDTYMGECMVVATKGLGENTGRARFVCLTSRPNSLLAAQTVASQIRGMQTTRRLEGAPHGGDDIYIGDMHLGTVLDSPIDKREWIVSRVSSLSLLQTAYHLKNGKLHLPLMEIGIPIPITTIGEVGKVGLDHRKIKDPKFGAFEMRPYRTATQDGCDAFWKVSAEFQRAMLTMPDYKGKIRPNKEKSASEILLRNSRTHYHINLGFSSNSIIASWTEKPSIGVVLTNVRLTNPKQDAAWTLWTNSTLGLLCHWMNASKQQTARGQYARGRVQFIPTLDVRKLTDTQLKAAEDIFADLKEVRMLPYNECAHDEWRHILDARLLAEVLGITDKETHIAMQELREKLCAEPSIAGTKLKKNFCNLEKERKKFNLGGSEEADAKALERERRTLETQGIYYPKL